MTRRLKNIRVPDWMWQVLVVSLLLAGCDGDASQLMPTDWPTLIPSGGTTQAEQTDTSPKLIDQFRVSLSSGTLAAFPIQGNANVPIRVEAVVLSGEVDPILYLGTIDGKRLASISDSGVNVPEVLGQFQFPFDAYFELEVGSVSGSGELGVSVYQLGQAQGVGGSDFDSVSQVKRGVFRVPSSYHRYSVPLNLGQRVNITARSFSPAMPVTIQLFGPNGEVLPIVIDNSDEGPAIWNFLADHSGNYVVLINNVGDAVGEYELEVGPSVSGGEAVIGARTVLTLSAQPRQSTWLTLNGTAYDGIQVEVRPVDEEVDPVVTIYDQVGHQLTRVDSLGRGGSEVADLVQFPATGTYQIEFLTNSDAGDIQYYIRRIRLVDAEIGGRIYPGGRAESGEIYGPGTVIVYFFEAEQGELIGVDAHGTGGTGLDLGFDLFSPDGSKIASRDDVIGKDPVLDRVNLPLTGTYALALWNFGSTAGPYEVYITLPEVPSTSP